MKRAALITSHLLDPIVILSIVTLVAVVISGLEAWQALRFFIIFFFGVFLPPLLLRIWAVRNRVIKNPRLSKTQP